MWVFLIATLQLAPTQITGVVTDAGSGKAVGAALVRLVELDRQALTDSTGRYRFDGVPAGPQHVAVSAFGYAERNLHAFVPTGGALHIDFALAARPLRMPGFEVRPHPAMKGGESDARHSPLDTHLTSAEIRNHPLLAEPDVLQALSGASVYLRPENPSGVNIRGASTDQTAFLLDDIPVFNPYHAVGLFGAWNPDAIAQIEISAQAPKASDVLGGVVAATLRRPRARHTLHGALSTTQARTMLDGPIGRGGYLLSMRTGFPDLFTPGDEPSYLRAETADNLAALMLPLRRGELSVIGYEAENEVDAAAVANSADGARNVLAWSSTSLGAKWNRSGRGTDLQVIGWHARGSAAANWQEAVLYSVREEQGFSATVGHGSRRMGWRTSFGRSAYRTDSLVIQNQLWLHSLFAENGWQPSATTELSGALVLSAAFSALHFSPRVQARWRPSEEWSLVAAYARNHQFVQSLRNHESIVGNIFPPELSVLADREAVIPIANAHQGMVAVELRPAPWARLTTQAFARRSNNVLLAAPGNSGPYVTSHFRTGDGDAVGMAAEATFTRPNFGAMAAYAWQRVRLRHRDDAYRPEHGVSHNLEGGVTAFPATTWSLKLGVQAIIGRQHTPLIGPLEWESCNLQDQGCEFGGPATQDGGQLGAAALPWYARLDVGVRKHWHPHVAGREGTVAAYGTVTNVSGRRNQLARGQDTGAAPYAINMRPRSVLLLGLDWSW